jgi:hypothetical protein
MVMVTKAEEAGAPAEGGKRERSTIDFPYTGLEDSIAVAKGIHDTTGSTVCQHEQLAAALGFSMNSSGYRVRLAAARVFGLIESSGGGLKLTPLGQLIVDSAREREAKVRAFLNVPLFKAIYDQNRGKQLPPPAALEREMAGLGVSEKQKERARQVFQRSAEVAGFFDMDRSRLVMPPGTGADAPPAPEEKIESEKSGNGGGPKPPTLGLHPFIEGLLKTLPTPDTEWQLADRVKWLQAAGHIFDLIYTGADGRVKIEIETKA